VEQGMKVAVVEGHDIGGTCVNRGCVPSKALLAASGRVRDMRNEMHLKAMGIQVCKLKAQNTKSVVENLMIPAAAHWWHQPALGLQPAELMWVMRVRSHLYVFWRLLPNRQPCRHTALRPLTSGSPRCSWCLLAPFF
jgi:hypothetical protein